MNPTSEITKRTTLARVAREAALADPNAKVSWKMVAPFAAVGALIPATILHIVLSMNGEGWLEHPHGHPALGYTIFDSSFLGFFSGAIAAVLAGLLIGPMIASFKAEKECWEVKSLRQLRRAKRLALLEAAAEIDPVKLGAETARREIEKRLARERAEAERRERHQRRRQRFVESAIKEITG